MQTILLIEDNTQILENLTEYLEIEGFSIIAATSGQQGFELAALCSPDLIICDVLMPGMDGLEVLHKLLNTSNTRQIPFVFSSSMSESIDKAQALKLGADDYLVKPFALETLLSVAKACIVSGKKTGKTSDIYKFAL